MGMKKVSLILPICNVSQYLRECLDSVVGQTLQELEIICVDDGSTDNSLEIIREYAARDERIVVITGPNGGYGKAMNKGLDRAAGAYIGIVEPDDYVVPEMFEELYTVASENDLDFVKADFYRFTRDAEGNEHLQYELLDATRTRYGQLLCPAEDPSCIRFTMNTWTGIYRREFIEKHGIRHNETPGASFQDNGFFFQTFIHARRAMIVNKPYYRNRRDNPNSSVKSKAKVYCMNVEYDHIRDLLMQDREVWERFQYMYWWIKYRNYWFTYNRIDDSDNLCPRCAAVVATIPEFYVQAGAKLDFIMYREGSGSIWNGCGRSLSGPCSSDSCAKTILQRLSGKQLKTWPMAQIIMSAD